MRQHPNLTARFARAIAVSGLTFLLSVAACAQWATGVTARATSEQVPGFIDADNVVTDVGLTEDPPGSGRFRLSSSAIMWNSAYGDPNDETPLIEFDLGSIKTVNRLHIWNYNNPGFTFRGFHDVTVQFSNDAQRWQTVVQRVRLGRAPGANDYFGQEVPLEVPVTARFIRLNALSTHRDFGGSDVGGLGKVRFGLGGVPTPQPTPEGRFPLTAGVVDVTRAPYFAKGDGVTDDTAAIQQAIRDVEGSGRYVYLPEGVYLVSSSLRYRPNASFDRNSFFGRNNLIGDSAEETIIRLKDGTFTNPSNPQAVLFNGFTSFWNGFQEETTADWFNNNVADLTIDVGRNNPGAIGMQFFSNNTGSVRNVRIVSQDGQGQIGLDLGHVDKNGPLLVKNLTVEGFGIGVRTGFTVNSATFETVSLKNQTQVALLNQGQCLSIRALSTTGSVPALRNDFGHAVIVDSELTGLSGASAFPAIRNGEYLFARNVEANGFGKTIQNTFGGGANVTDLYVNEYTSTGDVLRLWPTEPTSLGLQIRSTPEPRSIPASQWVNVRDFRLTSELDDSAAFQRAIDSGARVVYFPGGTPLLLRQDVEIRGNVAAIEGFHAQAQIRNNATLRMGVGVPRTVVVSALNGPVYDPGTGRTFVLRDTESSVETQGAADVFLENVVGNFRFGRQRVWARQLNSEPEGTKVLANGSRFWVLGLKTERGGTLVDVRDGGAAEVLGGLCYTTTAGGLAPMFTVTDSRLSVSIGEVCYTGDPFTVLVRETRDGVTRQLNRGEAPLRFSFMQGSSLPLFVTRGRLLPLR